MQVKKEIERIASELDAMGGVETEGAFYLRHLLKVYEVAFEMVHAKTHEHSRAAYAEMIDLIKGKRGE